MCFQHNWHGLTLCISQFFSNIPLKITRIFPLLISSMSIQPIILLLYSSLSTFHPVSWGCYCSVSLPLNPPLPLSNFSKSYTYFDSAGNANILFCLSMNKLYRIKVNNKHLHQHDYANIFQKRTYTMTAFPSQWFQCPFSWTTQKGILKWILHSINSLK